MNKSAVIDTQVLESRPAGMELGNEIARVLGGQAPDVVILFASAKYEYQELLQGLHESCRPGLLVGCSTAGEFTGAVPRENSACAVALRSDEMAFSAALGRNLRGDRAAAAREMVAAFRGPEARDYAYRSAMVLTDALAGYADDLIEQMTLLTAGSYQWFGGGAGDDARFKRTHVFLGREAVADAAVTLEILSNKPIGVGMKHGWTPGSQPMRVTEAEGMRLISLNAIPAVEAFQEYAASTGQAFDPGNPLSFFLHNVVGIASGNEYRLRVPLEVLPDGAILCAADIPAGSTVCLMKTSSGSAAAAAAEATQAALRQLADHAPQVALFFDCVATRLRSGGEFGVELDSLQRELGTARFAGCNTYGQISRTEGQFGGFHNCTAVVAVFPE